MKLCSSILLIVAPCCWKRLLGRHQPRCLVYFNHYGPTLLFMANQQHSGTTSPSTTSSKGLLKTKKKDDDDANDNHGGSGGTSNDSIPRRVLWNGPLFGRLTRKGRYFLLRKGWKLSSEQDPNQPTDDNNGDVGEKVKACTSLPVEQGGYLPQQQRSNTTQLPIRRRLAFVWPNKTGPQISTQDPDAAHVRPYPTSVTEIMDDKIYFAKLLQGRTDLVPPTMDLPPQNHRQANKKDETIRYFVKHRHGVQGKSVYVMNWEELQTWWSHSKNPHDFVVQQEVYPIALYKGYKFVLRSHVLVFQKYGHPLCAFLHKDVICQSHAVQYTAPADHQTNNNDDSISKAAAHISNAKSNQKQAPPPKLVQDLDSSHPAYNSLQDIRACCKQLVQATRPHLTHLTLAPATTCFALLGIDLLISLGSSSSNEDEDDDNIMDKHAPPQMSRRKIVICEVNSHPALGWGTMTKVPAVVFERLVEDSLSLLLLDGNVADSGYMNLDLDLVS